MCYKHFHKIMYYNIRNTFGTNLPVNFLSFLFCFMHLYICLWFLCIVIYMHSFHSAHIFKVCNSVIWPTHSIFNYGHIVKLYSHFVYSPLNSYVYIHWILDFKYILLLNIYYYNNDTSYCIITYATSTLKFYNCCVYMPISLQVSFKYLIMPYNNSTLLSFHSL